MSIQTAWHSVTFLVTFQMLHLSSGVRVIILKFTQEIHHSGLPVQPRFVGLEIFLRDSIFKERNQGWANLVGWQT
jgi:hypothetical protein